MKTTYILGAGFSCKAGLPLMNNFYFKSKDLYPKLKSEVQIKAFENVFDYYERFSKVKNYINVDFFNIEELLSIIEMDSYLNNKRAILRDYLIYIKTVINRCSEVFKQKESREYLAINYNFKNHKPGNYMKFLLKVMKLTEKDVTIRGKADRKKDGILSLNYDLILEYCLSIINKTLSLKTAGHRFTFNYGLEKDYVGDYDLDIVLDENRDNIFSIPYAKIHGSVNFLKRIGTKIETPLLIPPTWNKTGNANIKSVWGLAYKLISRSEKLVFIGYSIPETDIYLKYLLINGIKDCENLKKVDIVCYNESDDDMKKQKERYYRFFEENFKMKAVKYYNIKFEDWIKTVSLKD